MWPRANRPRRVILARCLLMCAPSSQTMTGLDPRRGTGAGRETEAITHPARLRSQRMGPFLRPGTKRTADFRSVLTEDRPRCQQRDQGRAVRRAARPVRFLVYKNDAAVQKCCIILLGSSRFEATGCSGWKRFFSFFAPLVIGAVVARFWGVDLGRGAAAGREILFLSTMERWG